MSTMLQYTEKAMNKMLKRELIPIVLLLQNKVTEDNNAMLQEIRKFNDNFAKIEAVLVVKKSVNSELCKRIVTKERQCWANGQYSRTECLEVAGIPRQVDDKNLGKKMLPIFQKIGCTTDTTFIDDCNRLGKNNHRVIVKFARRKDCKQILKVKKDLRDLNMENLDLPRGTKIYINQSLRPYYRIWWSKAKKLQNIGSINNFYISSVTIKIKVTKNSRPITITHLDDFNIHFPDIDLSLPTDTL